MFHDKRYEEHAQNDVPYAFDCPMASTQPPPQQGGKAPKSVMFPGTAADGKEGVLVVSATNVVVMTKGSMLFCMCCSPDMVGHVPIPDVTDVSATGSSVAVTAGTTATAAASNADAPMLSPTTPGASKTLTFTPTGVSPQQVVDAVLEQHAAMIPFGAHSFSGCRPPTNAPSVAVAAERTTAVIVARKPRAPNAAEVRKLRTLADTMTRCIAGGGIVEVPTDIATADAVTALQAMQVPQYRVTGPIPTAPGLVHPNAQHVGFCRHGLLTGPPVQADWLLRALPGLRNLTGVELSCTPMSPPAFQALTNCLPVTVRVLDFSEAGLQPPHVLALAGFVNRSVALEALTIDGNRGCGSVDPIADALCMPVLKPTMRSFSLDGCETAIGPRLLAASRLLPRFEELSFDGSWLDNSPEVADQLRQGTGLKEVTTTMLRDSPLLLTALLSGDRPLSLEFASPLKPDCVQALVDFDHPQRRQPVHIKARAATEQPNAQAFGHMVKACTPPDLSTWNSVTGADLSLNVDARSMAAFVPHLERLMAAPNLKVLLLEGGFPSEPMLAMGPGVARALSMLANNTSLTALDITGNNIGDAGIVQMGNALRQNRTLTSVNYDDNGCTDAALQAIRGAMYGNKKLVEFPLPQRDLQRFQQHLNKAAQAHGQAESRHRSEMKMHFKRRNRSTAHQAKNRMVTEIKGRKAVGRRIAKLKQLADAISMAVASNYSAWEGKMQAKEAEKLAKYREKEALKEQKRAQRAAESAARRMDAQAARRAAQEQERAARRAQQQSQRAAERAAAGAARERDCDKMTKGTWRRDRVMAGLADKRDAQFAAAMADPAVQQKATTTTDDVIQRYEAVYRQQHEQYMQRVAQAQQQPLPPGWVCLQDQASGRPYYFHQQTNRSTWADPRVVNPDAPPPQFHSANYASDPNLTPQQVYAYQLVEACHNQCYVAPLGAEPQQNWSPAPQYQPYQQQPQRQQPPTQQQQQQPQRARPLAPGGSSSSVLAPAAFLRYCGYRPPNSNRPPPQRRRFGGGGGSSHHTTTTWYTPSFNDHHDDHNDDDHHLENPDGLSDQTIATMWELDIVTALDDVLEGNYDDLCDVFQDVADLGEISEDIVADVIDDLGDLGDDLVIDLDIDGYGGGADVSESESGDEDDDATDVSSVRAASDASTAMLSALPCASSRRTATTDPFTSRRDASSLSWSSTRSYRDDCEVLADEETATEAAAPITHAWYDGFWADVSKTSDAMLVAWYQREGTFETPKLATTVAVDSSVPSALGALSDLTVVTQCTVDRLDRLAAMLRSLSHGASVSATVYQPADADVEAVCGKLRRLERALREECSCIGRVRLTVAHREGSSAFYPINACRNVALDGAATEAVLLLDVDFRLSDNACDVLAADGAKVVRQAAASDTAFVLPAFESHRSPDEPLPTSLRSVVRDLARRQCTPFHVGHYPRGHTATDYDRWQTVSAGGAGKPYSVAHEEGYEPYVVVGRSRIPRYDERFTGYGFNKVQHLHHLAHLRFEFVVVPGAFVVCRDHAKSADWKRTFGAGGSVDPLQRLRIQGLFQRFKSELVSA